MFERVVESILTRLLGQYIENLNSEQLRVAVWRGDIFLKDLVLRKDALDSLQVPITVLDGRCNLHARFPWRSLQSESVHIKITDLFILTGPQDSAKWSEKASKMRKRYFKQQQLETAEMVRTELGEGKTGKTHKLSFSDKMLLIMFDNLVLTFENVHIRYEDFRNPALSYACGVTIRHLTCRTVNENGCPLFVSANKKKHPLTNRKWDLHSMSVYWETDPKSYTQLSPREMAEAFRARISTGEARGCAGTH